MRRDHSLILGTAFGFILARAGATDPSAIHDMFRFADLHLLFVIGVAVVLSALVFAGFRRGLLRTRAKASPALATKPWRHGVIYGGLLFGVGWALTGTCPGTALAQIGEGRLPGLVTFAGILAGAMLGERLSRPKVADAPVSARQPARST